MSAKHTPWSAYGDSPAPWTVDDAKYDGLAVKDANGGFIADVTDGHHGDDGEWIMADKCSHIARLIEAGPELLALARKVARIRCKSHDGFEYDLGELDEAVEAARAAIAKAEGAAS